MEHDFFIENHGSIVAITPMSADANKAVDAGAIDYEDWQLQGCSIMVDARLAGDLVNNLKEQGFTFREV